MSSASLKPPLSASLLDSPVALAARMLDHDFVVVGAGTGASWPPLRFISRSRRTLARLVPR